MEEVIQDVSELLKFKHILEYFVAHQNYKQSGDSESAIGYQKYIKPYIDDGTFQHTGQGYKDGAISISVDYPNITITASGEKNI